MTIVAWSAGCQESNAPDPEMTVTPGSTMLFVGGSQQFTALAAPGPVVWSSTNAQVASVVPETGFVRALARGESTINATSGGKSASVTVSVLLPPSIRLAAATIAFQKTAGDADPAAQTVAVTNAGDGTISNLAVGAIAYGAGQPTGWLTATSSGATTPATITLTARGAGLAAGTYTAIVPIQAPGIDNTPQNIGVTFRVLNPASIVLSRTTVPMAGIPGSTIAPETVNLTNGGDAPLTGLGATVTYGAGQTAGWLTAALGATTAPTTVTLTANTTGLAVGNYTATVRIASTVAGVAPRDITVQLSIAPGAAIQVNPTTVSINAVNGVNPAPVTVNITNTGGGTLTGLSTSVIYIGGTGGWLTAALNTTTAPATITLNVASAALAAGVYTATLRIASAVASNSPFDVPVSLRVGPGPNIAVNPGAVSFATWGNGTLPGAQPVQVTNSEAGPLTGLSVGITYPGAAGWLNATFSGGTNAPTTLLLVPNTSNLPAGTHTATVTISSSLPGVTPRTVSVSYVIQTFSVHVFPFFATANCAGCHGAGNLPNMTGNAQSVYNQLITRVVPGSPSTSLVVCKLFTLGPACAHTGGKYNGLAGFAAAINDWILNGAPFQ